MRRRIPFPALPYVVALAVAALHLGPVAVAEARRGHRPTTPVESPDDKTVAEAGQTLEAARTALGGHDLGLAYKRAAESFRLVPTPDALLVLGRIALAEGRALDAQDLLRRYLADPNLEAAPDAPDQREAQRIAEQPRPASAQLTILGDRGTVILVDGRVVGVLPLSRPLLLSASEHKVELERGDRHVEDQVRVPVGRVGELRLDLMTRALVLSVLPGVLLLDEYRGPSGGEQRRLELALEEAVQAERLSPLSHELALELAGEPAPGPCSDERRCVLDLAGKCEADYVLRVHVDRQAGGYKLSLDLYDLTVIEQAGHAEQSCPGCTVEQAARTLAGLFAPLYGKATGRARGQLDVTTDPPGADLLLDGEKLGQTPFKAAVWAGSRELVLRKQDHEESRHPLLVRDGETAVLKVELRARPEPPPLPLAPPTERRWVRGPRPRWRFVVGAVGLAAGAVMAGFGISALNFQGQCVGGTPSVGICAQVYNTLTPGIGLTAAGGVLLGVGVGLMAWPGPLRSVEVESRGAPPGPP